jgi:hypothetical protein
MSIYTGSPVGVRSWKLMGNVSITGNVSVYEGALTGAGATRILDFNGFNLTITGNLTLGSGGFNTAYAPNVGAGILTVTGNFYHYGIGLGGPYLWNLAAGQMLIGGNFTLDPLVAQYQPPTYSGAWLISVGGSWNTSGQVVFGIDTGTVRFTAGAGFVIACSFDEIWPEVEFTGGGSTTLPNPFNCYNIDVIAGTITVGAVLIVRNLITNAGTINLGAGTVFIGGGVLNTGIINGLGAANIYLEGPLVRLSGFNPVTLTMSETTVRLQLESAMTIGTLVIEDRAVPGIIVHLAAALFSIGTMNSQVQSGDGCVQLVSSAAGVQYVWRVTGAITSVAHLWPRDCAAATSPVPPVGDLSNKNLGNNTGWTLNTNGQAKLITDDVGSDILSANGIGPIQYCWLVDTSVASLTARAAAFGAGADNWHRKTNIPFALIDNLNVGGTYYIALGLVDDRDRRLAPNIGGGDYVTAVGSSGGGGGAGSPGGLHVQTKTVAFA